METDEYSVPQLSVYSSICYMANSEPTAVYVVECNTEPENTVKYELMSDNYYVIKTSSGDEHRALFECDPGCVYCMKVTIVSKSGEAEHPNTTMLAYDLSLLDNFTDTMPKNTITNKTRNNNKLSDRSTSRTAEAGDVTPQALAKRNMAAKRKEALHMIENFKQNILSGHAKR